MSPVAPGSSTRRSRLPRLAAGRPSPCRFDPSCSSYALEALERHGAARGSWLTLRRLVRCHPWGGIGWDPVPDGKAN